MNKNILWLIGLLVSLSFGFASCKEDDGTIDPYENWQERNEHYIDSIADVANNPPAGETWEIYKNYKLDLEESAGNLIDTNPFQNYDYVYVKMLKDGNPDGEIPTSADTAYVCYQGYLINGECFDSNYTGELDLDVHESKGMALTTNGSGDALIIGWMTALYHMKEGTQCELYIPYQLAYGEGGYNSIPGYSVLKFNFYLDKVVHPEIGISSGADEEKD